MRLKIFALFVALGLLLVVGVVGTASAIKVRVRAGDMILDAHGDFFPKALPKFKNAPIITEGGGKISTVSGDLPPILDTFLLEFDKHGALDTTGLPVCTEAKLIATDVAAARRACGPATVGTGFGKAIVKFPEQGPIPASSPLTIFNGPKKGRNHTIIAHAHLDVPAPTTYIVPIVIEKIRNGVYGYRVFVDIPKIAGGYGHPISGHAKVGKKWVYKGKKHSYINARCETGHFQVRGEFSFKEVDELLKASFVFPCKVRG
jgi:hypothetical protein